MQRNEQYLPQKCYENLLFTILLSSEFFYLYLYLSQLFIAQPKVLRTENLDIFYWHGTRISRFHVPTQKKCFSLF